MVGTFSITDKFSASLLKVEEEIFVMVLLENETVSKGGKVEGHQFYWCDYYLYIAGVAKEMIDQLLVPVTLLMAQKHAHRKGSTHPFVL